MPSLEKIINPAKREFRKEYEPKIAELGYNLVLGINTYEGSYAILAIIQDTTFEIPLEIKDKIEDIIPHFYRFCDQEIPVLMKYYGKIGRR